MKVIKYGRGMKCKRHYITECGNCHTIFDATPKEVEFLGRNDEPVEYPTPTYRTYCPVCGDTRIYEIKKKNKKQKFSSVKALLKADRDKEIEQYGKQVSMRPSKVHKSKKDYDRKKNKVDERDLE